MVETHQVQNRRVEIVDVDRIFGHIDPVFIRFSISHAGFDARAS